MACLVNKNTFSANCLEGVLKKEFWRKWKEIEKMPPFPKDYKSSDHIRLEQENSQMKEELETSKKQKQDLQETIKHLQNCV